MNKAAMLILVGLIKKFEGLRLHAYRCPAGVWTCGYGSTGPDIKPTTAWTERQAEERADKDANVAMVATMNLCKLQTDSSLAAISDFTYNLGATRLAGSTLRRKINSGDTEGAKRELFKWVRGGGKVLPGLVLRRKAEATLLSC